MTALFFTSAPGENELQSFGWEAKNLFRNSRKRKEIYSCCYN